MLPFSRVFSSGPQLELLALRIGTSGLEGSGHCGNVGVCEALCSSGPKFELRSFIVVQ